MANANPDLTAVIPARSTPFCAPVRRIPMSSDPRPHAAPASRKGENSPRLRTIRSFGAGRSRVTRAQQRSYEKDFPRYSVAFTGKPIEADACFGRQAPLVLEI